MGKMKPKRSKAWKRRFATRDVKPGPIRHKEGLPPVLEAMVRESFATIGHLVVPTFEQWELGFLRDVHPEREVLVFERISRAFRRYVDKHPEAAEDRQVASMAIGVTTDKVQVVDEQGNVAVAEREVRDGSPIRVELAELFKEEWGKRWHPDPHAQCDWPAKCSATADFEGVVDEYGGGLHPSLKGLLDPRVLITAADIVLGEYRDSPGRYFIFYGWDLIKPTGNVPAESRVMVIRVAKENEQSEKIAAVIKILKGRHDLTRSEPPGE